GADRGRVNTVGDDEDGYRGGEGFAESADAERRAAAAGYLDDADLVGAPGVDVGHDGCMSLVATHYVFNGHSGVTHGLVEIDAGVTREPEDPGHTTRDQGLDECDRAGNGAYPRVHSDTSKPAARPSLSSVASRVASRLSPLVSAVARCSTARLPGTRTGLAGSIGVEATKSRTCRSTSVANAGASRSRPGSTATTVCPVLLTCCGSDAGSTMSRPNDAPF